MRPLQQVEPSRGWRSNEAILCQNIGVCEELGKVVGTVCLHLHQGREELICVGVALVAVALICLRRGTARLAVMRLSIGHLEQAEQLLDGLLLLLLLR